MVDLVTGGTGYVGQNLVKALINEDRKVRVLIRDESKKDVFKDLDVEFVYGDLNNEDSLIKASKGVNVVYHLAAQLGGSNVSYKKIYDVNVRGTENLLNACFKNKVNKFIHFSSVSAMGEVGENADEEVSCNPRTPYDKSKLESELVVKRFIKEGFPAVIIRPSVIYGPGSSKTKATMFSMVKKGMFFIIGKGDNLTDMTYIDNVINGVLLAAKSSKAIGGTYILGDERAYTMNEFFNMIARKEGVKNPRHLPKFFAYLIAIPFEIIARLIKKKMPLSFDRIRTLTISKSFSIEKAKKELGYEPKINLEEGVKRTVKWYSERGIL